MTELEYWKKRCEAAELVIEIQQIDNSLHSNTKRDEILAEWNELVELYKTIWPVSLPEAFTKEYLLDRQQRFPGFATVGDLKRFLERHPSITDESIIMVQRITDSYFDRKGNGWNIYYKEGEHWHNADQWNKDIDNGKYLDKENYPRMTEDRPVKFSDEVLESFKEQYHPLHFPVFYKDDEDILFLDAHY